MKGKSSGPARIQGASAGRRRAAKCPVWVGTILALFGTKQYIVWYKIIFCLVQFFGFCTLCNFTLTQNYLKQIPHIALYGTKSYLVWYKIFFGLVHKKFHFGTKLFEPRSALSTSNPKSDLIHNPDPLWVSSVEALQVRNKPSLIVCNWIAANF